MIENTRVPEVHRRAFLGQIGAAMLAALAAGCTPPTPQIEGIRPDQEEEATPTPYEVEKGIRPDWVVTVTSIPSPEDTPTHPPAVTGIRPEREKIDTPTPSQVVRGIRPDRP